jgi:hypothetical protein
VRFAGGDADQRELDEGRVYARDLPHGGELQQCVTDQGSTALLPVETVLVRSAGAHMLRFAHLSQRVA